MLVPLLELKCNMLLINLFMYLTPSTWLGKGHEIVNDKEDFNVDVVSKKNGYTYFNEAEVKVAWKGDWPTDWREIRIPARKRRLVEKYKDENGVLNFYVFNEDLTKAWRIKDTLMTDETIREAKGKNIWKGETFFHIPYEKAELIELWQIM